MTETDIRIESEPLQSEKRLWSPPVLVCETYQNTAAKVPTIGETITIGGLS
jgi:hypothetical protein